MLMTQERRAPTLEFALEAELLPFKYHKPAFAPLFQLPPELSTTPERECTPC